MVVSLRISDSTAAIDGHETFSLVIYYGVSVVFVLLETGASDTVSEIGASEIETSDTVVSDTIASET